MAHLLALVATQPPLHLLPPAVVRDIVRQQSLPPPGTPVAPVGEVRELYAPGPACDIPLRLYRPAEAEGQPPLLMFVHGGGWVFGDLDSHDAVCRTLCREAGAVVVSVGYRLAPEHRFPAALDDTEAALRWLFAHAADLGAHPLRLALAGDSAGAQLAATAALRTAGEVPVVALGLIYPPAHPWSVPTPAKVENGDGKVLTREMLRWCAELYLGDDASLLRHPETALLRAPGLHRLPPTWLATLGHDPLRDDGLALLRTLRESGVTVQHLHEPAGVHGCLTMPPSVSDVGPRVLAHLAAWLRQSA